MFFSNDAYTAFRRQKTYGEFEGEIGHFGLLVNPTSAEARKEIPNEVVKDILTIASSLDPKVHEKAIMEILGFSLALSRELKDEKEKKIIERKIVDQIKMFLLEKLEVKRNIALANLFEYFDLCKSEIELIRKRCEEGREGNLQKKFEEWVINIFEYVHRLLGGALPDDCEYAIVGIGSLATRMVTSYSDVEYIVLLKEHKSLYLKYFTNFSNLFHLIMTGFGETSLHEAKNFLENYLDYFKHIRKGARVDQYKNPSYFNGKIALIDSPKELLQVLPDIIHEPGNHTTAALLTVRNLLTNNESLVSEYQRLLNVFLPSKEYFICMKKLLEQCISSCKYVESRIGNHWLSEKHDTFVDVKEICIPVFHLGRMLLIFLKSSGQHVEVKSNFEDIVSELEKRNFISIAERKRWLNFLEKLHKLRLNLQIKSKSADAKISLKDLNNEFNVENILAEIEFVREITLRVFKRYANDERLLKKLPTLIEIANKKEDSISIAGHFGESMIPPLHDDLYIERTAIGEIKQKLLDQEINSVRIVVLHGPFGVGKTQIAAWHAHDFRNRGHLIRWIDGDILMKGPGRYITNVQPLDEKPPLETMTSRYIEDMIQNLKLSEGGLIIFDNVNTPDFIVRFYFLLKKKAFDKPCYIIVTSSNFRWESGILKEWSIKIKEFEWKQEGSKIMDRAFPTVSDDTKRRLFNLCAGYPITLMQYIFCIKNDSVGDSFEKSILAFSDELKRIPEKRRIALSHILESMIAIPYQPYNRNGESFFAVSDLMLRKLFLHDPNIASMLKILTYLNINFIELDFLRAVMRMNQDQKLDLANIINVINTFSSMCITEGNEISLHREFRHLIREMYINNAEKIGFSFLLVNFFNKNISSKVNFRNNNLTFEKLYEYLSGLIKSIMHDRTIVVTEFKNNLELLSKLLSLIADLCDYRFHAQGDYNECVAISRFGLEIIEDVKKESLNFLKVRLLKNFFLNNASIGNFQAAIRGLKEFLLDYEKDIPMSSEKYEDYIEGIIYLGFCYFNVGSYRLAIDQFEKASIFISESKIDEYVIEKRTEQISAFSLIGSGMSYTSAAIFDEASRHLKHSQTIYKNSGQQNPKIAESTFCLGLNSFFCGMLDKSRTNELKKAEENFGRAEDFFEKIYPNGHADLAETKTWQGWYNYYCKNPKLAEKHALAAIEFYERSGEASYPKSILAYLLQIHINDSIKKENGIIDGLFKKIFVVKKSCTENNFGKAITFGYFPPIRWSEWCENISADVKYYENFLKNMTELYGDYHPQVAFHTFRLARSQQLANKQDIAKESYQKALDIYSRCDRSELQELVISDNIKFCKEMSDDPSSGPIRIKSKL